MSTPVNSDALWTIIAPLFPPEPSKPKGGRSRSIADRAALTGIVSVLKRGIPREMLPQEMGCASGMTCWRRLRDWQKAGSERLARYIAVVQANEDERGAIQQPLDCRLVGAVIAAFGPGDGFEACCWHSTGAHAPWGRRRTGGGDAACLPA